MLPAITREPRRTYRIFGTVRNDALRTRARNTDPPHRAPRGWQADAREFESEKGGDRGHRSEADGDGRDDSPDFSPRG